MADVKQTAVGEVKADAELVKAQNQEMQGDSQEMTQLMQQVQEMGMNRDVLSKLFEAMVRFGPASITLIKQMIEFWNNPTVPLVQGGVVDAHGHCNHEELCRQTLAKALDAATAAAVHYQACCNHPH